MCNRHKTLLNSWTQTKTPLGLSVVQNESCFEELFVAAIAVVISEKAFSPRSLQTLAHTICSLHKHCP